MAIKFGKKFEYLDDRTVRCPFFEDIDVHFTIRRLQWKPYQDALEPLRRSSEKSLRPLAKDFIDSRTRAQMQGQAKGLRGLALEKWVDAAMERIFLERKSSSGELDDIDDFFEGRDAAKPIAEHLVANVVGLEDESGPVDYSPKVGVEILSLETPFGIEYEDGDLYIAPSATLGAALRAWVLHEANQTEKYRVDYISGAEENLDSGSTLDR